MAEALPDPLELKAQLGDLEGVPALEGSDEANPARRASSSPFKFTHVSELLKEPEPLEWEITGYILPGSNIHLVGEPASGKSLIAIDWACCKALGKDWHGRRVKQSPAVLIAGEGHFGISRRLKAWCDHHQADLSAAPLAISNTGAALNTVEGLAAVVEAIQAFSGEFGPPGLIVVDTLHRNFQGNENSAEDFGAYQLNIDHLRDEFGAAVVTVHHTGHIDKNRGRGSSSMLAAVDFSYLVEKSGDGITMKAAKHKDAPMPPEFACTLQVVNLPWYDSEGQQETSVTITPADPADMPRHHGRKMPAGVKLGIETLHAAIHAAGDGERVHLEQWRERFYSEHTGDNTSAKKVAFQRARKDLVAGGAVEVADDVYRFAEDLNRVEWSDVAEHVLALTFEFSQKYHKRNTEQGRNTAGTCSAEQGGESGTTGTHPYRGVPCSAPCSDPEEDKAEHSENGDSDLVEVEL